MPRHILSVLTFVCIMLLPGVASAQTNLFQILEGLRSDSEEYLTGLRGVNPPPADPKEAQKLFDQAQLLIADKPEEARKLLEKSVALGGQDFDTWQALSQSLRKAHYARYGLLASWQAYQLADQSNDTKRRVDVLIDMVDALVTLEELDKAVVVALNARQLEKSQRTEETYNFVVERLNLAPDSVSVIRTGTTPKVCFDFSYRLDADQLGNHAIDYVQIDPKPAQLTVVADSSYSICLDGLDYRTSYTLTLLPGLPFIAGVTLPSSHEYEVQTADREAAIGFTKQQYVLPKLPGTGLPVRTVNYDAADLQIYRVPERELAGRLRAEQFSRPFYSYEFSEISAQLGEAVWQGQLEIDRVQNQEVVTAIDLNEFLTKTKPGVYILGARGRQADQTYDTYFYPDTAQWFIVSDLGVSTYSAEDGLTVAVRSLASAKPLSGVTVKLLATNNEELSTAKTDQKGLARFDPGLLKGEGGRRPLALTIWGKDGDFSFLSLTGGSFDLSDRGVAGNRAQASQDLYLYSDRDLYRRGETIHAGGLLRALDARAIAGAPLLFTVLRPDGIEFLSRTVISNEAGGYDLDVTLPENAYNGTWTIEARNSQDGPVLATLYPQVEDIIPPTIEVSLTSDKARLAANETANVTVSAKYLYGAAATELATQSQMTLSQDEDPFPGYEGYAFGPADERFSTKEIPLPDAVTDADGKAAIAVSAPETESLVPLKARLRTSVIEFSGRAVNKGLDIKLHTSDLWIGAKPDFDGDWVNEDDPVRFDLVALDGAGKPLGKALKYQVIREEYVYRWYSSSGNWSYDVSRADAGIVATGRVEVDGTKPSAIAFALDWGQYRLEISDDAESVTTSTRFSVGWYGESNNPNTPDQLQLVADKESYNAGETATIKIKAPFAGRAQVMVATDRILSVQDVDLPKQGGSVSIKTNSSWGAGAYVLVTGFRPGDSTARRGPARAIGVTWVGLGADQKRLSIDLATPDRITPRQKISVPVTVTGQTKGETVYVTLAAVDEGVLQLSGFQTPDPLAYFFEQRRLGVDIRDLYGQLIAGYDGKKGRLTQGGDDEAAAFAGAPSDFKIVALYSGTVKLNKSGQGTINLDVPDYNGRLRLMAVAYSKSKMGSLEKPLITSDPVVMLSSTARFLAPGDASTVSIQLQNITGPSGQYKVSLHAEGPVTIADSALEARAEKGIVRDASQDVMLAQGDSDRITFPLSALSPGKAMLRLTLEGPQGAADQHLTIESSRVLTVRPAAAPVVQQNLTQIMQGQDVTLSAILPEAWPGSSTLFAAVAAQPPLDIAGVLAALDRYPYGCIEQTVSRAMPLLWADALEAPSSVDVDYRANIQGAIARASLMQRYNGSFGLWSADSDEELWLSAFATDFLWRAKEAKLAVPENTLRKALGYLSDLTTRDPDKNPSFEEFAAKSYGFYVLARANLADIGSARQFFDAYGQNHSMPLALMQLAGTFDIYGDTDRRDKAIAASIAALDTTQRPNNWYVSWHDYGSGLRDLSAMIAILSGMKDQQELAGQLILRLGQSDAETRWMSTQEQAWYVMAAASLPATPDGAFHVSLDGEAVPASKGRVTLKLNDTGETPVQRTVRNDGTATIWLRTSRVFVPNTPQPAESNGLTYKRTFYLPNGTEANLADVKQGDILVAVVTISKTSEPEGEYLLADLLPAGFELINRRIANDDETGQFSWLPDTSGAKFIQYLDDRFVAAFRGDEGRQDFTYVYSVRAVTPGAYVVPGGQVEEMYQPRIHARGEAGTLTVTAAK